METFSIGVSPENENLMETVNHDSLKWSNLLLVLFKAIQYQKKIMQHYLDESFRSFDTKQGKILLDLLEDYSKVNVELRMQLQQYRKDISVIREFEEVGCEEFFFWQHINLRKKIENLSIKFYDLKLELINYRRKDLNSPIKINRHEINFN